VEAVTGRLVIANHTDKNIVICSRTGRVERKIPVRTSVGVMRCALSAGDDGYIVLDGDRPGRVHWLDSAGNVTHTYGVRDGESLQHALHMVRDSRGRLLIAEINNHRVSMVGADRRLVQHLLTAHDGVSYPYCLFLDETTSLLYVAHGAYDTLEVRVYKWPTTAPSTAQTTNTAQHTLHVKLGRYK
jgi:hypothetical protein